VLDSHDEAPSQCNDMGLYVQQGSRQDTGAAATRYIKEILEPKMLSSTRDLFGDGGDFIFQQDGAPCHTARVCTKWFQQHSIQVLPWPGNSPDLNPIENLWSSLKKLVAKKRPANKSSLIEAIITAWFHIITPAEMEKLVASMPRRCKGSHQSQGLSNTILIAENLKTSHKPILSTNMIVVQFFDKCYIESYLYGALI